MEQMLDNLAYCLNATVPIFLLMVLGMVFRGAGLFDQRFSDKLNGFVFKVSLPVMLFRDLAGSDFFDAWDGRFVLFCFLSSLASIVITTLCSLGLRDKSIRGEFVQAGYRSSIALLGVAFLENLYGSASAASLVIVGAVPLYNVAAVVVLAFTRPGQNTLDKKTLGKTFKGIVTNPLVIAIVIGVVWSMLKIPQPVILRKTVSSVSATATPLGLMALGASFDLKRALGRWKPAMAATIFKLGLFAGIFLPIAIAIGFRQDKLIAVLAMLGGPTTVSCFVMARSMGHEGTLTSSVVMLTTFFSAFSLTAWLFLLKSLGMI